MEENAPPQNSVVAIVLPKPTWSVDLLESFESACKNLTGDVDVIKIRKSLNKDEDAFIQAFVNHCLSKVDADIKDDLECESKRIKVLMKDLQDMNALQLRIYKKEKVALEQNLVLGDSVFTFDFYVYESDLEGLKEMTMLKNLINSSSSIKDISTREIQEYVMRIAKRAQLELETGLKEYLSQCKIPIALTMKKLEPLGGLREYRRKYPFVPIPDASEGDWERWNNSRTKEAYNEDVAKAYSYKQMKWNGSGSLLAFGETPVRKSNLRQSTVKLSVELDVEQTLLPVVKEVLDSVLLKDG